MQESENEITDEKWREKLSPDQYKVLRKKSTEKPFTGKYWDNHEKGMYFCSGCGAPLFDSETKFESGSGWPSFYAPVDEENIEEKKDTTFGMVRTEVLCKKCGGHLGHRFDDGPKPTGQRYCINSISLDFKKEDKK